MREIWAHTKTHDREAIVSCEFKYNSKYLIFNQLHNNQKVYW